MEMLMFIPSAFLLVLCFIIIGKVLLLLATYVGSILNFSKIIEKMNKYVFLISTFIIYTLLGLTMFKIKLAPLVEMSKGVEMLYYFQKNFTHSWELKLMISLIVAIVPAILLRKRISEDELS